MILVFHCKPNAKNSQIISSLDGRTFVATLHAPPRDGLANEELVNLVADKLNIPKSFVVLVRGHSSKVKHLEIPDGTSLAPLK